MRTNKLFLANELGFTTAELSRVASNGFEVALVEHAEKRELFERSAGCGWRVLNEVVRVACVGLSSVAICLPLFLAERKQVHGDSF